MTTFRAKRGHRPSTFRDSNRSHRTTSPPKRRALAFEPLEDRQLLSIGANWEEGYPDLASLGLQSGSEAYEAPLSEPVRRAVVVGVSNYLYVNDLSYCDDDARDFRAALLQDDRWLSANISLLVDSAASKAAVQGVIASMASAVGSDDICVIFFSGHGSNGPDVAPYDEADGYDEYICPWDTTGSTSTMIRDDEFSTLTV